MRFRGNQFTFDGGGALQHRARLLLDVDGLILTSKQAEVLGRLVEITLHADEPFFQENTFAMRRRSGQLGDQLVEFIDIGLGDRPAARLGS